MGVALAGTWRPRGELDRFLELCPLWLEVYEHLCLSVPPDADELLLEQVRARPGVTVVASPERGWGRYLAIEAALEGSARHIHLADVDRLLRWSETRPDEWRQTVRTAQTTDCLIIGRSEAALQSHPKAIRDTESVVNAIFSYVLGQPVDLGGGSRGFSRIAADYLMTHSQPGRWGDAEWPVLLHRAGLAVDVVVVDGLDWESADRFRSRPADANALQAAAVAYDVDPNRWAFRVRVAQEIIDEGLEAARQPPLD